MGKKQVTSNQILISVGGLVVLLFGYYWFFIRSDGQDVISLDTAGEGQGALGQDILVLSQKLETLSIDKSLFSSALFTTLQDLSFPLIEEEQGRSNPFAKIGSENVRVSPPVPKR